MLSRSLRLSGGAVPIVTRTLATKAAAPSSGGTPSTSERCMQFEDEHSAHNYHPLPVVLSRGSGVFVYDCEGREYIDCLSAYSAVNQGHGHPKILKTMIDQVQRLSLTSRAFHNDMFGPYAKFISEYFHYDRVLPMNTGAEGVETALKLARKWGYTRKGIAPGEAVIISCEGSFHGRTFGCISLTDDPSSRSGFEPLLPGVVHVPYNDPVALEKTLQEIGNRVCGFIVEPIQGEAGVNVPDDGYLKRCKDLCTKHNVLMISDEIQTGLCRTGRMLCSDWDGIRPDVVILGKALSGGVYPISAVLADDDVMLCIQPGEHGSTYGGNPVACAVAMTALNVLKDEHLAENAQRLGSMMRADLNTIKEDTNGVIETVRGRGLLNAIVINDKYSRKSAFDICLDFKNHGLLAKPTHDHIIRLAPPLCINEQQLKRGINIIDEVIRSAQK